MQCWGRYSWPAVPAALNQYLERRFDAQMRRTSRRPLAAGRLNPSAVLWFGIALSVLGTVYLAAAVNLLASLLALGTLFSYLFFYTPLKRKSPLCTLVGAVPGAMPPLIGWAAASGQLNFGAWILYSVLFLWQFPHFMSIAWMYREDYARAGYLVLPHDERARSRLVNWQTLLPLLLLLPVSLLPAVDQQGERRLLHWSRAPMRRAFCTTEHGSPFESPTLRRDSFFRRRSFIFRCYLH